MKITVHLMSGAGNIFSVIDGRSHEFNRQTLQKIAHTICYHNPDKPTEGFICVEGGDSFIDFGAHFFNPDGSYGAMCGNGGRCAVLFAHSLSLVKKTSHTPFVMSSRTYTASINSDNTIRVSFPRPAVANKDVTVSVDGTEVKGGYFDVGSDHFVTEIPFEEFESFDLVSFAKPIRYHKDFEPRGVNVNIFTYDTDKENRRVRLRTYERGVEAETGACGTGAISTALYIALTTGWSSPITLIPPSGDELRVYYNIFSPKDIGRVSLEGNACFLDKFEMDIDI